MKGRAVFLDRDGVLNEAHIRDGKPYPPSSVHELHVMEDAADALGRLKDAGFRLFVVTNQPDVARGKTSREAVEAINRRLCEALPIDDVFMCLHDDGDHCDCRKPKPGMIRAAAQREQIDLDASVMVGDRWRDIEAGRAAGCRTVLIGDGYAEGLRSPPDYRAPNLTTAANWILDTVRADKREG
ncbi:MAG TPA: HAD family hydrolase [Beijerinckiaceae bacterium]